MTTAAEPMRDTSRDGSPTSSVPAGRSSFFDTRPQAWSGPLRRSRNVSSFSTVVSPTTSTAIFFCICPGANVRLPLVEV